MKQSLEEDSAHQWWQLPGSWSNVPTGAVLSPCNPVSFDPHNYSASTVTIIPFPAKSGGWAGGGGSSVR